MKIKDKNMYFSIIIPAYNEEKYIAITLDYIKNLNYPKSNFEVFVVENGSVDNTLNIAKEYSASNIKISSIRNKSVSVAKNYGINIKDKSDWTIILDADTLLERNFLNDLEDFIKDSEKEKNIVVGTTSILPIPESYKSKIWFKFYDFNHKILKTSYSIQIIKSSILKDFSFNEDLAMGEDLALIDWARKKGKFFFFETLEVKTSTRRFEKEGYWSVLFLWVISAILVKHFKKMFSYKVVR